jgi:hypothetical protein
MVAAFEMLDGGSAETEDVASRVQEIAAIHEELSADEIRRDVNEDRAVSGFPEVASVEAIEEELKRRRQEVCDGIMATMNRLPTGVLVVAMNEAVDRATSGGATPAPHLLDMLVDAYEVGVQDFLEKEAANVRRLIDAARRAAPQGREAVGQAIAGIDRVARNWDRVAQPIQLSAKTKGLAHEASRQLAFEVRQLAVDLFNRHDLVHESKRLTDLLGDVFAEVPDVAEQTQADASAIESILKAREARAREITYSAEVGAFVKNTLSISPAGVTWKGQTYPLDQITTVRWGGIRRSVNGIPTGTTYTVAFGDSRLEEVVQLRRQEVYSAFIEKLWRAVGARLATELVTQLKANHQMQFGEALIGDAYVVLKKHKWIGSEPVRCKWQQVHIWDQDGSFFIGASADKNTYAAVSYINVPNAHVLEYVIRVGFKQGIERLSDILKQD